MNVGSLVKIRNLYPIWHVQVRNSRYGPQYMEPTFRKQDLEVELNDDDPRKYSPIKAAENYQNSFSTYDDLVEKFIRFVMRKGKKEIARLVVSKAFENIKHEQIEKYNKATEFEKESIELSPFKIFSMAVDNCKPLLKLEKVKRGGVVYQVPVPLSPKHMIFYSMNWIIESVKEGNRDIKAWDRLSVELLNASNNEGKSVKKKQELHRLCEANRAYAHFRW